MRGCDNHEPRVVLASRKNAGIRVTLLWAADTDTTAVLVRDNSTNEQFELLVEPEANPMDVYEHPYAYAPSRRIAGQGMSTIATEDGTEVSDKDFGEGLSELSSRSENGVDVALLWRQCDNRAIVVLVDHRRGEEFALDVHQGDNALDMFDHPYAYAAHRRLDHGWPEHGQDFRIAEGVNR